MAGNQQQPYQTDHLSLSGMQTGLSPWASCEKTRLILTDGSAAVWCVLIHTVYACFLDVAPNPVRVSLLQAKGCLKCAVLLCMIDEQSGHLVEVRALWISADCYQWGLQVLSMCQTADWCVSVYAAEACEASFVFYFNPRPKKPSFCHMLCRLCGIAARSLKKHKSTKRTVQRAGLDFEVWSAWKFLIQIFKLQFLTFSSGVSLVKFAAHKWTNGMYATICRKIRCVGRCSFKHIILPMLWSWPAKPNGEINSNPLMKKQK